MCVAASSSVFVYADIAAVVVAASVVSMLPSTGPVSGGTNVTVTGIEFVNSPLLSCMFGSQPVTARWISTTQLWCLSPPEVASVVAVEISNNYQQYTSNDVKFSYQRTVTFLSADN